ncbi:Hypothetical predicted protein [Olea europaea subsp. europaea]|uniref:Uncharacterized protein n=1 Tax=Olea europaea subsp. europaea TaxID=158383 RepID=A0A8S0V1H7_OLEEU|nr:Hypothetical predicted protein [Olea europaea subsp. europaea]
MSDEGVVKEIVVEERDSQATWGDKLGMDSGGMLEILEFSGIVKDGPTLQCFEHFFRVGCSVKEREGRGGPKALSQIKKREGEPQHCDAAFTAALPPHASADIGASLYHRYSV